MLEICSLGHACYTISTDGLTLITDPFLSDNPDAVCTPDDLAPDYILVSHGHHDHTGDAVQLSKSCKAPVIGVFELCSFCERHGADTMPMHIGGGRDFEFGRIKLTPALHGSGVVHDEFIEYTGMPCGFLITIADTNVYFAGDTGLFGDMELIARNINLDVAILPIGDNFTMGIDDAVTAAEMLQPRIVIPTHYHLFELIRTDPGGFADRLADIGVQCRILEPKETMSV